MLPTKLGLPTSAGRGIHPGRPSERYVANTIQSKNLAELGPSIRWAESDCPMSNRLSVPFLLSVPRLWSEFIPSEELDNEILVVQAVGMRSWHS